MYITDMPYAKIHNTKEVACEGLPFAKIEAPEEEWMDWVDWVQVTA